MAIDAPLSLQTHPNLKQAQAGFAREDALGISRTAPNRNYRDPNHKPELICALTEMDALCGFRPAAETIEMLNLLDDSAAKLLGEKVTLGLNEAMRAGLHRDIFPNDSATAHFGAAARVAGEKHLRYAHTFGWWAQLCDRYPGDGGIAVAALLRCVRLLPGQALFLGAGNMHAYLSGLGIEIMANSDNVLRGGLTPKHVDIAELSTVTTTVAAPLPLVEPVDVTESIVRADSHDAGLREALSWSAEEWPVPVDDFRLVRLHGESETPMTLTMPVRPLIVLCTEGGVTFGQGEQTLTLVRGESGIIGNAKDPLTVQGHATVFLATSG